MEMTNTTRTNNRKDMFMETNNDTAKDKREQYEEYYSHILKRRLVQYEYRDRHGELFSCIADTLEEARKKRDDWLISKLY